MTPLASLILSTIRATGPKTIAQLDEFFSTHDLEELARECSALVDAGKLQYCKLSNSYSCSLDHDSKVRTQV